jgi:hypothetical protein
VLRTTDRYAYRLWKHCLFCRDCLGEKGHLYTSGVRPALLATPGRFTGDHPVDHAQLARLTLERGLFATPFTHMGLFKLLGAALGPSIIMSPFMILSHSLASLERMRSKPPPSPGEGKQRSGVSLGAAAQFPFPVPLRCQLLSHTAYYTV